MNHPVRNTLLGVLALALVVLGVPVWKYVVGYNLRTVEPGAFYGARQMGGPALERYIDKLHIGTVLNVRGANPGTDWYDAEVAACKAKQVTHLDFGWSRNSIPDPASLLRFLDALDTAKPPFLAHCQGGTHRTGFAAAAYELNRGRGVAAARAQFGPMFKDAPIGDVVAMYEGSPLPFRTWVETEYPALYEAWRAQHKGDESDAGQDAPAKAASSEAEAPALPKALSQVAFPATEPVGQWVAFDVTEAARAWVADPESNFGVILRETPESAQRPGALLAYSSEAWKNQADGLGGGDRINFRPLLVVQP